MKISYFSKDILDFVKLLAKYEVRYVIVGGAAVIYYGSTRLTGDVDFFYDSSAENAAKLFSLLKEFWKGHIPGIKKKEELTGPGIIIQFGRIPNRVDLVTSIDAVTFENAWQNRLEEEITIDDEEYPVYFIGLDQLIKNKGSVKRPKDIDDLEFLEKLKK